MSICPEINRKGKSISRDIFQQTYQRKFSTKTINDRQLSSQKIRQKLSVIITNTNPPLQTLLFSRQNVKENAKMNHFFNIIKSK